MHVRPERPEDTDEISGVLESAFPSVVESVLVQRLRENNRLTISLVAVEDMQLLGYIGFSPVTVGVETIGLGLAPVAVMPEYQRNGVGSQLIIEGLRIAATLGFKLIVVLGDPSYYCRFGFRPASELGLKDEYGGGDAFQAKALLSIDKSSIRGLVKYAREFESLENEGST
jgi:putative acetyltransferase